MKKGFILLLLTLLLAGTCSLAMARTYPNTKTLEETTTYESETLKITTELWCHAFNNHELRFFVCDIWAASPTQLLTAFAGEEYSKSNAEKTSSIAGRHDAVLAINGDYYNSSRDNKRSTGLIIRNGVLYQDKRTNLDMLLIMADGSFRTIPKGTYEEGTGEQYLNQGAVQCFNFGPILVDNGEIVELPSSYIISLKDSIREPRTAIGWVDGTHYIIIEADGRRDNWSFGMTVQEMQDLFLERGCQVAYNMDGGGSATLVINGERINKTGGSRERDVSDIIYFTN